MPKKYRALRFVVGLYRVLAWVALALGIIAAIATIIAGAMGSSSLGHTLSQSMPFLPGGVGLLGALVAALLILVYTALLFVIMWAGSDFVSLFMDIEQNTRETALYLRGELNHAPARPEPVTWNQPGPNV